LTLYDKYCWRNFAEFDGRKLCLQKDLIDSLCYFEYPEQPDATKYRNAKRRHYTCMCKYHFGNRTDHDEAIETIEQRDEITLRNKL